MQTSFPRFPFCLPAFFLLLLAVLPFFAFSYRLRFCSNYIFLSHPLYFCPFALYNFPFFILSFSTTPFHIKCFFFKISFLILSSLHSGVLYVILHFYFFLRTVFLFLFIDKVSAFLSWWSFFYLYVFALASISILSFTFLFPFRFFVSRLNLFFPLSYN